MKKTLSLLALFGSLTLAQAQYVSTNIYVEDWGTVKDPGSPTLAQVGWTILLPAGASGGGPYTGIFSGPPNEAYFEDMAAGTYGMFYTITNSGAGADGDAAYPAAGIDPTVFTNNLTLNITRASGNTTSSNYFAVLVGGQWYVSTNLLPNSGTIVSMPYTNLASAWYILTTNAAGSGVTIGSSPTANLSGVIAGVGMVVTAGGSSWNFGQLTVSALVPPTPPIVALYSEDWGAGTGGTAGTLAAVGWNAINIAYTGMYSPGGPFDTGTDIVLSNRSMYLSMDGSNPGAGLAYTTDTSGAGTLGDSTFTDINPTNYPAGVTLGVETYAASSGAIITNYFAIQVAGNWYVAANPNSRGNTAGSDDEWSLNTLLYTNNSAAANWNTLTVVAGTSVTVGGPASAPLTGLITGVGLLVVQNGSLTGAGGVGYDFLNFSMTAALVNPSGATAPIIDAPGFSQTTFAGGTAAFAVDAFVGTAPLAYTWTFAPAAGGNPVTIANGTNGSGTGSFIIGALTNLLSISNVSSADAGTYSVKVGNLYGADYSSNYTTNTLTVNPLTNDILYAETFPFVGPFAPSSSVTNVGWNSTLATPTLEDADYTFAYATGAKTVAVYAATNTATASFPGIPFPKTGITPANYPFISFRATLAAMSGTAAPYFAVQMAGGKWYVSTSAITLSTTPAAFTTYGLQFSAASNGWNTLTLGTTTATVGSGATANLTGNITGGGVVFVFTGEALYAMNSFMVVTDSTPPILPSFPSEPNEPYVQTVAAGGGVSFTFTEAGTLPLTNTWQFDDNGISLTNGTTATGSIISGANTTQITLQNVSTADSGTYDPTVSNPAGVTNTDSTLYGPPSLTVTNPPVGYIYSEFFPLYAPTGGANQNVNIIGWAYQAGQGANRIFSMGAATGPTGALSAFESSGLEANIYDLYYASTTSDTGFSGLPFIAFDPANYPANSIQFSTVIANGNAAYTNVAVSFAVQQGGQWYASANPIWPFYTNTPPTTALPATYTTLFSQTYSPQASQWDVVSILAPVTALASLTNSSGVVTNVTGVVVGGPATQNLSGPITAAGLLFNFLGAKGGDINFNSFVIQATGSGNLNGGINISPFSTNGTITLSWIGNPATSLQSEKTLIPDSWTNVPNTAGMHSLTVPLTGQAAYFRLVP